MNAVAKTKKAARTNYAVTAKKRIVEYLKPGHELFLKDIAEALAAEDYKVTTIVSSARDLLQKGILEYTSDIKPSTVRLVTGKDHVPGIPGRRKSPVKQGMANITVSKIEKPVVTQTEVSAPAPVPAACHTNSSYDRVVRNKVPDLIKGIVDNYTAREISDLVVGLRLEVARIFGFDVD